MGLIDMTRVARRPITDDEPLGIPSLNQDDEESDEVGFAAPDPNPQLTAMRQVAEGVNGWRPAREVLTRVKAVPTIFIQYNRATRVGGQPIERFTTVHGQSGHGKTTFVHGLGLSFLRRSHFYNFVDAEYTTPEDWLFKLFDEFANHPGFLALRPRTYEETVDSVRRMVNAVKSAKERGKNDPEDKILLAPHTSALIAVDSLRKLVPEDILTKIMKSGAEGEKGSVDGMGGRAAQIKAAMNAAWLDELTPLLYHTGTAMVVIARESEKSDASAWDRKSGNDYKIGGGKSVVYDSSLVTRVELASLVKEGANEDSRTIGERHKIVIRKTKVSGRGERGNVVCYFHTSNGVLIPEGFDFARDAIELGREYKIIEGDSWLKYRGVKAQGVNRLVKLMTEKPDLLAQLQRDVSDRFRPDEELPFEADAA